MSGLNRIKVVLTEQNKTSKWLAEMLEKDPATVSRWCNNRNQPSLDMLDRIAKLLEISMKDLVK